MRLALLLDAELDAEIERDRQLQAGIEAEESVQLPVRDSRNIVKARAKHEGDVQQGENYARRTVRLTAMVSARAPSGDEDP